MTRSSSWQESNKLWFLSSATGTTPRRRSGGGSFTRAHPDRLIHHEGIYKTTRHGNAPSPLLRMSLIVNGFQFILIYCLWMCATTEDSMAGDPSVILPLLVQKQQEHLKRPKEFIGGHPTDEQPGNCYCNGLDNFCMCTPKLAVDIILILSPTSTLPSTSLEKHDSIKRGGNQKADDRDIILLRSIPQKSKGERQQIQQATQLPKAELSLLSDFVTAGETVEGTAKRLIQKDLGQVKNLLSDNLDDRSIYKQRIPRQNDFWTTTEEIDIPLSFAGVYSDPQRATSYGSGQSTVSAVFYVKIIVPSSELDKLLKLGEISSKNKGRATMLGHDHDVPGQSEYKMIKFEDIDRFSYVADHQTILQDYRRSLHEGSEYEDDDDDDDNNQRELKRKQYDDSSSILRSTC